jgi:hypothetical protein
VANSVASLFDDFSKERTAFSKAYRQMGKAQCKELATDRRLRSRAVADLLRSYSKAHRHMAKAQYAGLAKARRDRSRAVTELVKGFHVSRESMASELAEGLALSTQETKNHVSDLRLSVASMLKVTPTVDLPVQTVSELGHADSQVGQAAEPFTWPVTGSKHKVQATPQEKSKSKSAISHAGEYIAGKLSKKK